ncbi:MAG: DUF5659 domain-containing protein [Microgenomates group bacterium]|jgi:hypothetical protein
MENTDKYLTTSFYTAVFLILKGYELLGIEKIDSSSRQSTFVFKDTPERAGLLGDFYYAPKNSPKVMVDFRDVVSALKSTKDKLYQQNYER